MRPQWYPDWSGETCVIVASGPSAGTVDLSLARGKARFIAINESWRLAPWADVLYGCDDAFWKQKQGVREFTGLRISQDAITCARYADGPQKIHRVICDKNTDNLILDRPGHIGWGGNSGLHAINLAVQFGVKKILLVGYDMRLDRGLHWHGKHATGMNNPIERNVERWCRAVDATAPVLLALGIDAINCSLVSNLKAFVKMPFDRIFPKTPTAAIPESSQRIKDKPMRILAIATTASGPEQIFSFGEIYSYYLTSEMIRRGIDLSLMPINAVENFDGVPLETFDCVIGFGLRYWNKFFSVNRDGEKPTDAFKKIRARFKGVIAQTGELPPPYCVADVTFTSRGVSPTMGRRHHPPFHVIGWAADHDLCSPKQQKNGPLRILFDHPQYNSKSKAAHRVTDHTQAFINQVNDLRSSGLLAQYEFTGIEIDMLTTPKAGDEPVPFSELAKKYGNAHVYINGHNESVGLSVIEAATAGCLVVTPKGYIHEELLSTVRRVIVNDGKLDWQYILRKINPAASRKKATEQSWSLACEKMLSHLETLRK